MTESKRTPSSKQVLDIHKPGQEVTSGTSKPVIVGHRQILRDPMVNDEATTPVEPVVASAATSEESTVLPLTAPELPRSIKAKYGTVSEASTKDYEPKVTEAEEKSANIESQPIDEPKAEPATSEEVPDTEDISDQPQPVVVHAKNRIEPSSSTVADVKKSAKNDTETKSAVDGPKLPTEESESAKDAAAEKAEAELQKLILSKKYYLPINSVEKKRVERFIAIGILLSLILVLAWIDIALDAGLVHFDNIHPVTHFFSS